MQCKGLQGANPCGTYLDGNAVYDISDLLARVARQNISQIAVSDIKAIVRWKFCKNCTRFVKTEVEDLVTLIGSLKKMAWNETTSGIETQGINAQVSINIHRLDNERKETQVRNATEMYGQVGQTDSDRHRTLTDELVQKSLALDEVKREKRTLKKRLEEEILLKKMRLSASTKAAAEHQASIDQLRKEKENATQEIFKATVERYKEEFRQTDIAEETNKQLNLLKQSLKQERKKQNDLEAESLKIEHRHHEQLTILAAEKTESEKKIDAARNTNEQILVSMAKLKAEVLEFEDTCRLQREEISAMSCCISEAAMTLQNFQSRPVYLGQRDQSVPTSRGLYRGVVHLDQHFLGSNQIRRAQRSVMET